MRLTYANVVSTLALFLVLTGGAAYAAHRYLTRKSVGAAQLKSNAVTTAKIKANAITTRKIKRIAISGDKLKEGAVTTEKLANAAVNTEKINLEDVPFGRIVFETRGRASVPMETAKTAVYPLESPTYMQEAGSDDSVVGALDVAFKSTCKAPRQVQAYVLADAAKPEELTDLNNNVVATGQLQDENGAITGGRINLGSYGGLFQPAVATKHTLALVATLHCNTGDGATATFGAADVIGTRK